MEYSPSPSRQSMKRERKPYLSPLECWSERRGSSRFLNGPRRGLRADLVARLVVSDGEQRVDRRLKTHGKVSLEWTGENMTTAFQLFMSSIHQLLFRFRQVKCLSSNLLGRGFLRWLAVHPFHTELPPFLDFEIYSAEYRAPFLDFLLLVSAAAGGAGSGWKVSTDKLWTGQLV